MRAPEDIQPCLFDRLIDEEPGSQQESRTARVISLQRYRASVLRDIGWLLNSHSHGDNDGIQEFGEAANSILDFGIPDLTGRVASGLDLVDLEREIVRAIEKFEPRIMPGTVTVKTVESSVNSGPNIIAFEIHGELWANPIPDHLYIKTQIDLETGQCTL
jgi:type VI secretion system protein ImpF